MGEPTAAEVARQEEARALDAYLASRDHRAALGQQIAQAEFRLSTAKDPRSQERWAKELARLHSRRRKGESNRPAG